MLGGARNTGSGKRALFGVYRHRTEVDRAPIASSHRNFSLEGSSYGCLVVVGDLRVRVFCFWVFRHRLTVY